MKGFLPQIRADLIRSNINTLADVIKESTISGQANKIKSSQSENILSEELLIKAIQTAMSINHAQPTSQNAISDYKEPSKQFYKQPHSHEPVHEISSNVVCATSKDSDQPAHRRSLIRAFASRLNIL